LKEDIDSIYDKRSEAGIQTKQENCEKRAGSRGDNCQKINAKMGIIKKPIKGK